MVAVLRRWCAARARTGKGHRKLEMEILVMSQHFYIPIVILDKPSFPISVRYAVLALAPFNVRDAVSKVYPLISVAESKFTFNETLNSCHYYKYYKIVKYFVFISATDLDLHTGESEGTDMH
jgi:hypothetical protein